MGENEQDQLFHDLGSFNNSMIQLSELINANLNDPQRDARELATLQAKLNSMLEMVQGVIKTKSERIVEEIIPNYFLNLASTPVPPYSGDNRKRKLVTFDIDGNGSMQHDEEVFLPSEDHDFNDFDNLDVEDGESPCLPVNVQQQESQKVFPHLDTNMVSQYQSYYTLQLPETELPAVTTTSAATPEQLSFNAHSNTMDNHLRGGRWVEYEEIFLKELVAKYKSGPKGRRVVDWSGVARELRRNELDCKVKWSAMCDSMAAAAASGGAGGGSAGRGRKGPYKVEEDQLIMTTVQDYLASANSSRSGSSSSSSGNHSGSSNDSSGDANDAITAATIASAAIPNDVWDSLEKTMGRPAKNIRLRWRITLVKRVAASLASKATGIVAPSAKSADNASCGGDGES